MANFADLFYYFCGPGLFSGSEDFTSLGALLGSVALRSCQVICFFFEIVTDNDSAPKSLRSPALSRRYYRALRPLVPAVLTQPAKSGGNDGRAWYHCLSFHVSPVGHPPWAASG